MLSFLLSTLAAVSLALPSTPQQADKDVAKGKIGKEIRSWVENSASTGFRGAVLAAKDGKVVAAFGVGHADLEGKVAIDSNTLFEIASITKQFTAAAVMHLVQDGKVELDEPISTYLPGIPEDCQEITVRHLLQHTSGIPGSNSRGGGVVLAAVLPSFLKGGPQHKPGTNFEYWNQGYALVSEIVARASGDSYTGYVKKHLFQPAGMKHSFFTGDEPPAGIDIAIGIGKHGKPRSALEHPYGSYGFQYRGMGGAVLNVWDFWRWDRALCTNQPLSRESKAVMFETGDSQYGLGWYVVEDTHGRTMQAHSGSVRGFNCYAYRFPEEDACVIVLSNDDRVYSGQIGLGIREILFEDKRTLLTPPDSLESSLAKA
ncbi:MAG: serine hydrolase domain-containing protein, partial [Planctomycetota bacterium]